MKGRIKQTAYLWGKFAKNYQSELKADFQNMTHKQKIFVSEYVKTGNATESAKKAGYSDKTAYSTGQRLLKNVEIRKDIERMQSEALEKAELSVSDVVKLVKQIATEGKNETVRLRAMDMLLKYLGAYADDAKLIARLSEDEIEKLANRLIEKLG